MKKKVVVFVCEVILYLINENSSENSSQIGVLTQASTIITPV
jgi:hypothetical protein